MRDERFQQAGGNEPARRIAAWGWALVALGPVLFAAVNVWTRLHDQPELAGDGRLWEVWTWEMSSAVATLALLPAIGRVVASSRIRSTGLWRHLVAAPAFAVVHIAGFVLLRTLIYEAAGSRYVFGGLESWVYELPKDLVTYAVSAGLLTLAARPRVPPRTAPGVHLEVRDGAKRHRLAPDDIVAVEAAGNYVRIHTADGRRVFVRETLKAIEKRTALLRIHRAWLINPAHVVAYSPGDRPDRGVELKGGPRAPLARRYAAALKDLMRRSDA